MHFVSASDEIAVYELAIAALKAQVPCVLTLGDLGNLEYEHPVWVEYKRYPEYSRWFLWLGFQTTSLTNDYGITWRCWPFKPTAEQSKAEEWKSA
jgi:hypothetical protein